MDTNHKLELLTEWQEFNSRIDKLFESIYCIFGSNESEIHECVWRLFEAYTKSISIILCDTSDRKPEDYEEWLNWYCYDNEMGKKGYKEKADSWKRLKKITNLNLLLKVMTE